MPEVKHIFNNNFYNDLFLDMFLPTEEEFFTIVHFHGGGLVEGDKGDTHLLCEHLAEHGFAVATANYSLMPKAKFPEYLYEAAKAVKYVSDNISKYGKSKGIIISGQSAGAFITMMLCFNKEYLASVGIDNTSICGWVSDAGQPTTHFHILELERGLSPLDQVVDEAAPLFYVNEKTKFSHLLLMAYEEDLPNRVEQNKLLLSAIKELNPNADVEFKLLKKWHCHGSCEIDEDGEFEVVKEFLKWSSRL